MIENPYEAKQAARKARLLAKAKACELQADALSERAVDRLKILPFGQPIVENSRAHRHRALLERSDQDMRRAVNLSAKASYYQEKADSVGLGGISGNDPEALSKLKAHLAKQEAWHALMKKVNALFRKGAPTAEELLALGVPNGEIDEVMKSRGFLRFQLTNNLARIKHTKSRIAELENIQRAELLEAENDLFTLREDREENRFMFTFDGKPSREIITLLKRHGYKWSQSRTAWVRQITANARAVTKYLLTALEAHVNPPEN